MFVLIILAFTALWSFSFFGLSIIPGIPRTGGFIYLLSVLIVLLIIMKFMA